MSKWIHETIANHNVGKCLHADTTYDNMIHAAKRLREAKREALPKIVRDALQADLHSATEAYMKARAVL